MNTAALALITLSALMQASYSALIKKSQNKTVFLWLMVLISSILLTGYILLAPGQFPQTRLRIWLLSAAGGFFFVVYHWCTARAYRDGDLSIVYPLSQTAILWVPLWGVFMFHEKVSPGGLVGILLIVAGAYIAQMKTISMDEVLKPIRRIATPGVLWALGAGVVYSFGAIVDKMGVSEYPPFWFSYLLIISMCFFMTLNILRPSCRRRIIGEWSSNWIAAVSAGVIMIASFVAFRYGLKLSSMSYAVPVRQISVVIAVLIGVLIMREACGRIRFFSACLIFAGIICIKTL